MAMKIKRLLTNIASRNLEESKLFYTSLFSFEVAFDSDWFINLVSKGSELEIGIIAHEHEMIPERAKGSVAGVYMTFVVEDVDALCIRAQELSYDVMQEPEITFYGQKRMLLLAPEGTVCDVSSVP